MKYFLAIIGLFIVLSCSREVFTDPFDFFWHKMDEKYVYFEEKGIDWDAVYSTYKPRAATANDEELLQIFQEIIDLLKDGHVSVSTPDTVILYDWRDTNNIMYLDYTAYLYFPIQDHIMGFYDVTQLTNNIIYIYFNSFEPSFDTEQFREIISHYSFSKGIILDIRGNIGGNEDNVYRFASCFFTGTRTVLYKRTKSDRSHNAFSGYIPINVTGCGVFDEFLPIVLLIESGTYSGGTLFSAILKTLPHVVLAGMPTGGGGARRYDYTMPNGWTMSCSQQATYDVHYRSLELGVAPHYKIPTTKEDAAAIGPTNRHKLTEFAYQYLNNR
ncbi:MAG: S41 family peptidase [Prevotellaceae bacterium]|jgi:hypothetical protein|nr:S41 family peptidase [Prevotellaceae bacterium]